MSLYRTIFSTDGKTFSLATDTIYSYLLVKIVKILHVKVEKNQFPIGQIQFPTILATIKTSIIFKVDFYIFLFWKKIDQNSIFIIHN